MLKKILAIALSATCILGVFAGCDSDNKKADIEIKTNEDAKTVAEEVLKKAQNGDDFDTLMNKYSSDPGLATSPLGYIVAKNGNMVQEFEDASFALDVDQISDLVETSFGYHIIKRCAFDEDFYEENKAQLNTIYNSYICDKDYKELYDSLNPVYAEGYEDITVTNIDEFEGDTVFTVGDIAVPTAMFRYFLLNVANEQDQGDKTYWDDNAEAATQAKQTAETICIQYISIENFAADKGITLSDDDNTAIQSQIDQAIEQEGGQEQYEAALATAFLDEATFKRMLSIQTLQNNIYTELCGDTVDESTSVDDILEMLNNVDESNIVRVKHILISFPDEEETTSASDAETTLGEQTTAEDTTVTSEESTTAAE